MEKKITYVKDGFLHIRVDTVDLARWKNRATQRGLTLTEYVIHELNNTESIYTPQKRKRA